MSLDDAWKDEAADPRPRMTLRELIADTRLEQRRALLLVRQALELLAAEHAAGKVHGNVRPETITVTTGLTSDSVTLGGLGTKPPDATYSPPESVAGKLDARGDIYALGAVLYELLTGKPPFTAEDPAGLRRMHAYAPIQTLKQRAPELSFPEALETIVATALAKKRETRYQSAQEMLDAIEPVVTELEAAAPPPPKPGAGLDESLLLMAKELMPANDLRPSEPVIPANVSRQVPELPLHTRLQQHAQRLIDRVGRKRAAIGGAAVLGIVLIVAIAKCGGGDGTKPPGQTAAPKGPDVDLPTRCERLGHACSDTAKHITTVIGQCKQAGTKLEGKKCGAQAKRLFECYETTVCGKSTKIWAFSDLRVLAQRHKVCAEEAAAVEACGK